MDDSSLFLFHVVPRGQNCCEDFSHPIPRPLDASGITDTYPGCDTTVMGLTALPLARSPLLFCEMCLSVLDTFNSLGALQCFRTHL